MNQALFDHIAEEVAATAAARGWGHQVRRKWSVRAQPVSTSDVDDFEWKLIPDGTLPSHVGDTEFQEGVYFVLSYDSGRGLFVLLHDTIQAGALGRHWAQRTTTEFSAALPQVPALPHSGQLREHLMDLTERFEPNRFSFT